MAVRRNRRIILLAGLMLAPWFSAGAEMENYYVYQGGRLLPAGGGGMEWAGMMGTREARPFGNRGFEQRVGARYGLNDRLSVEGWGGALIYESEVHYGVAGEVTVGVLEEDRHGMDLRVGAGYLMDYQDVPTPWVRVTAGRDYGLWNTVGTALFEIPRAEDRDEVDVILGGAVSYPVTRHSRLGLELIAEDLEGYWEEEEAEGGAKLLFGPTLWVSMNQSLELKFNAAVVTNLTRNDPTRLAPGVKPYDSAGFQCGLVVGYWF